MTLLDWVFTGQLKRGAKLLLSLDPSYSASIGELYRFGCLVAQVLPFCFAKRAFLQVEIINYKTQERWSLTPIFGMRQEI